MKYVLGVDVGTTSMKAVLFDENTNPVKTVSKDYTLHVSGDRVEFPAQQYCSMLQEILDEMTQHYEIAAMSIDTQCETIIVTDEEGTPLMNAIVWLDNRAAREADDLRALFGEQTVYEVTGQPEITATWPACKLLWLKRHEEALFSKIKKVFLLEDYLLYYLTGRFVTERTLQSSTIYYDITKGTWWDDMLQAIGICETQLPQLLGSGEIVGAYSGITVVTGCIDQIAGAIGAGVVEHGIISEMTGTTMAIFVPSDNMPAYDGSKIPCHVNWDGKYCLLSWSPTAGIALKWFKNNFCEGMDFSALDELAEKVEPGSNALTFLPYLCGSTMPKYNPDARGAFFGLTLEHTRDHCVRAIMEAVACMLRRNLEYLGVSCREIRAMGGGAKSDLWCQIMADVCGKRIVTLQNDETACLGSAILAGTAIGLFESVPAACAKAVAANKIYDPGDSDYTACYTRFCKLEDANV